MGMLGNPRHFLAPKLGKVSFPVPVYRNIPRPMFHELARYSGKPSRFSLGDKATG